MSVGRSIDSNCECRVCRTLPLAPHREPPSGDCLPDMQRFVECTTGSVNGCSAAGTDGHRR